MKVSSLLKQLIFGPNTHTRARTHTHTHTRTCTRTHTHTRTRTRTCAYTYTHTHTHRQTHYPARGNKISIFLLNDHEYLINIHTCTLRRNQLDYCRHPSSINQYGNKWNTTFFTCVIWYGQWKYRAWQKSFNATWHSNMSASAQSRSLKVNAILGCCGVDGHNLARTSVTGNGSQSQQRKWMECSIPVIDIAWDRVFYWNIRARGRSPEGELPCIA